MKVKLAYGKGSLSVDLPDNSRPTIIRKPQITAHRNKNLLVNDALSNPVGSRGIDKVATGAHTACILICDITRPVPNHIFLKPIIERLMVAGVPKKGISILVATGLHRPNEGDELKKLIGDPWVMENINVQNHDALDDDCHVSLGATKNRGVPVLLNRRFVAADVKIATGLVEPHFMAGYSGGRKVVAPGIAHQKTIRTFHASRFMNNRFARSCNLKNNPLHEEQIEIISMLNGPVLGFNTVIDEDRNLVFASFGDIIKSHLEAVEFARKSCEVFVGRKFNTLLTSSAGYPLDKTYYQTVKGMVTPLDILAKGGTLIIVSECSEGFGSKEFRKAQERFVKLGAGAFFDTIKSKKLAQIDEWQTEMQLKSMDVGKIKLYSPKLRETDRVLTGVEIIDDIPAAVSDSIAQNNDPDIAIIPEGPYLIPFSHVT